MKTPNEKRKPQINVQLEPDEDAKISAIEQHSGLHRVAICRAFIKSLIRSYEKSRGLKFPIELKDDPGAAAGEAGKPVKPKLPTINPPSASQQALPNPSRKSRPA